MKMAQTKLPYLVGIYITALLLRPILASKILSISGIIVPAGLLVFPLSFICNDIFTEVYGYERSRSIVWAGLFCQILACLIITLAVLLPGAPFWNNQESFSLILGQNARMTCASMLGCFLGEITNSYVISRMKYYQRGAKGFPLMGRFVASTIAGELVDSVLYISLAFTGIYALNHVLVMILSTWILKSLYEVILLPVSTKVCDSIKRTEAFDVIDNPITTDYGIFSEFRKVA